MQMGYESFLKITGGPECEWKTVLSRFVFCFFLLGGMAAEFSLSVYVFVAVGDVEEEIFFVVFLVKRSHGSGCRGDDVVDEEEKGVVRAELNSLTNEEVKLAYGQVRWHQVFLLIQISDPRLRSLFHDHGHTVSVFSPDFLAFGLPLLERVLLLVLEFHVD